MTLAFQAFSRLLLLDGRQAVVDNDELGVLLSDTCRNLFDLTCAEQCRGPGLAHAKGMRALNIEADGEGEPLASSSRAATSRRCRPPSSAWTTSARAPRETSSSR